MTDQLALNSANEALSMTLTEEVVAPIWCEILQQASVTPADNFFALGGDSLMMMMVLFRVSDELGVELPPGVLLESPTLGEFCLLIDRTRLGEQAAIAAGKAGSDRSHEEGVI